MTVLSLPHQPHLPFLASPLVVPTVHEMKPEVARHPADGTMSEWLNEVAGHPCSCNPHPPYTPSNPTNNTKLTTILFSRPSTNPSKMVPGAYDIKWDFAWWMPLSLVWTAAALTATLSLLTGSVRLSG